MRFALEAGQHTDEVVREWGIRGVSVSAKELAGIGAHAMRKRLAEKNQEPCQIAAFGLNLVNPNDEAREALGRVIELAPEIGCENVVIGGGNYHSSLFGGTDRRNFADEALDVAAAEVKPFADLAQRNNVRICIEPYIKGVIHSPDAFDDLRRRVESPALRVNLDITNFYDFRSLVDPNELCRAYVPRLAEHVGLIHVKEIALEEGFHLHAGLAPITRGPTDWELVLTLAGNHCPTDTWLLLEHVLSKEEAMASIRHLRRIAEEIDLQLD